MITSVVLLIVSTLDTQWALALACPRVGVPNQSAGTGVVVGVRDGYAYVLTANHVVTADLAELRFTSRENYPEAAWFGVGAKVVARWPDPDVALVRFRVEKNTPAVLPLAPAGNRPKAFPVPVVAVGPGKGRGVVGRADAVLAKEFVQREGKGGAFFWRSERPSEPGQSGGPLLDVRGRVIGIAVAARDGRGYFAHHDEIVAALKRDGFGWLVPPQ